MDQRFSWNHRLHARQDFTAVFRQGRRYSSQGLTVWVYRRPADGVGHPRLGLAIPKAYGNAVARNRMKRLLRETFRLNRHRLLADVDVVFSARSGLTKPRYQTIEAMVKELWQKAHVWK